MEHKMMQVFAALMVFLALSFQPVLSQVVISKTGCGTTKQCVQDPDTCDPAGTTTCLFGSARPTALKPPNGIDLAFELSGNPVNNSGYIAMRLTKSQSDGSMIFVCGRNSSNNGSFISFSTTYNTTSGNSNDTLAKTMTSIQNTIDGGSLKCTFTVAGLNATTDAAFLRAADTTYIIGIASGQLVGGSLSSFPPFKLGNATDFSIFLNTTVPGGANRPFYSNAVLPLVSFLTLSILTFA
ncbi:putative ferric-chelate reductase 1 [Poecilia reticulata]|uniref:putative ferric-chelate reductase 1 n=1 Tax=Poecilia reticulata TaxID=8081 RepID=UPI0007EA6901|nr:PREDICTED: putative ferric-chelate reductase 1 [Poecilia reticulata]